MCDENHYPIGIDDLYPGTTYHYRKDVYSKFHLHIILTSPEDIEGVTTVVVVNLTTQRNTQRGSDLAVILDTGDHPFIQRPSVVSYRDAAFFGAEKIVRYINEEKCLADDLEDSVLKRVQQGLLDSLFTPLEVLDYCQYKFES
jgi:hypothetical protein